MAKGDLDKAIADYTEAIRLDAKHALAYNNRGRAYWSNNNYDKAIADYTEAIQLTPKYALVFNNRGLELCVQGRLGQGNRRPYRGHPARPKRRLGVQHPCYVLREQGRVRQGHCRLH